ncbi:hypothetical protein GDO81_013469 [Engystomops pustulosus]|uniref:Opioid growth factor receptor (OGFr) conserved domain-containing protein n=1 Tax=Engystomops pustulosus TaxID=76066 RepID=A0AAV7B444_ENGPU|nr:hypothetical protein GDO81_013469 [Engystomops pustulosus]
MSRDGGEDGWTSEYDSTWDDDDDEEADKKKAERARERRMERGTNYSRRWRNRAARDLQCYRHGYRGGNSSDQSCTGENCKSTPNLDFYQNKKCFEPNGLCIDDLLTEWKEDYNTLERNHSYIQWLFPLREYGMNSYAKPLTLTEIKMMKEDKAVMTRFIKAYKLMLQFYGIKVVSEETGKVERAENWEDRFKNLNYHSHNNLRITRMLKCLGEMGYEHFQAPLVRFFLEETLLKDKLPNVKRSVLDYFMFAVKDKNERRKLVHFAWEHYKPNNHQDRFIWGPVEKIRHFQPLGKNDLSLSSEGLRDDAEKNLDSKPYKNQGLGFKVHESGRSRDDAASQHSSKNEKGKVGEMIPMTDRGTLPENSPNHKTEANPDQSSPPLKGSNSVVELVEDNMTNNLKKEVIVGCKEAKDSSTANMKKEDEEETGLELNGHSNSIQNIESKRNLGEYHRKRKMLDESPMSPAADASAAGDKTQPSQNTSPSQGEDGGQVDGVEDEVKKLKLVERSAMDYPNGMEEAANSAHLGKKGDTIALSDTECNLKDDSRDLPTDE